MFSWQVHASDVAFRLCMMYVRSVIMCHHTNAPMVCSRLGNGNSYSALGLWIEQRSYRHENVVRLPSPQAAKVKDDEIFPVP